MTGTLDTKSAMCIANILRVMRGAGRPYQVIGDIESIAVDTITANKERCPNARTSTLNDLISPLYNWRSTHAAHDTDEFFISQIIDSSLRIVASRLEGNGTEESKGCNDLMGVMGQYREAWEVKRMKFLKRMAEQRSKYARRDNAVEKKNGKKLAAAPNSDCYVYFITDGEAIKIGKSNRPKARLAGLQTSHHKPLRILALVPAKPEDEREYHAKFRHLRIRGEWFQDGKEIRQFITNINRQSTTDIGTPAIRPPANDNTLSDQQAA